MGLFHVGGITIEKPEDIIPFLGKPDLHWKKEYSAYELAYSWVRADGFPPRVRAALDEVPEFRGANIVQAEFERQTDLRTRGRNSQTDLMVHVHAPAGDFVIGVEGKVDEAFGETVGVWLQDKNTRHTRLNALCAVLALDPDNVGSLRYQLFHRTVAAIFEAQAYNYRQAVMLVHSFSPTKRWLSDFHAFASALGIADDLDGHISAPIQRGGVTLRLGWVSDQKQP
jgi:hypothetical protein